MDGTDGNPGEASQMVADGIPVDRSLGNMHATYAITWYDSIYCHSHISPFYFCGGNDLVST